MKKVNCMVVGLGLMLSANVWADQKSVRVWNVKAVNMSRDAKDTKQRSVQIATYCPIRYVSSNKSRTISVKNDSPVPSLRTLYRVFPVNVSKVELNVTLDTLTDQQIDSCQLRVAQDSNSVGIDQSKDLQDCKNQLVQDPTQTCDESVTDEHTTVKFEITSQIMKTAN